MCLFPATLQTLLAQVFKVFAQLCPAADLRAVLVAGKVSQVTAAALHSQVPLLAGFCAMQSCMAPGELVAWLRMQCFATGIAGVCEATCTRKHRQLRRARWWQRRAQGSGAAGPGGLQTLWWRPPAAWWRTCAAHPASASRTSSFWWAARRLEAALGWPTFDAARSEVVIDVAHRVVRLMPKDRTCNAMDHRSGGSCIEGQEVQADRPPCVLKVRSSLTRSTRENRTCSVVSLLQPVTAAVLEAPRGGCMNLSCASGAVTLCGTPLRSLTTQACCEAD